MWQMVLLSAIVGLIIYMFYTHYILPLYHFKSKDIPHPKAKIIFGNVLDDWYHGSHVNQIRNIQNFGRVYGTLIGTVPIIWISDPDMIKEITTKKFHCFVNRHQDIPLTIDVLCYGIVIARDERWKRIRRILSPTFSTSKLKQALVVINDTSQQVVDNLIHSLSSEECHQTQAINYTKMYTTAILKSTLANSFGVYSDITRDGKLGKAIHTIFHNQGSAVMLASISPFLTKYFAKLIPGTFEAFNVLDDTVKQAIRARRKENPSNRRKDLLNLLLESQDSETLSEKEISAQATTFLLGGYESTRNTLIFATYLITTHPEIQQKLIDEIDSYCPDQDSLTYDIISKLPYLDMVVSEVLRLYPSFPEISRDVEQDVTIAGVKLCKGDAIKIPVYGIHRDSEFWPNPEKFLPERFSAESTQKRHNCCYLPFGLGPRSCIGLRLALFTIKVFLVKQLQQFEFKVCEQTVTSLEIEAKASLSPLSDLFVQIVKRK
ncbi:Cytochrome P450 3A24 [Trichoplax sp. H2]|nr:Cytochrome P450 3A24 [Trichoplax sp. H2]|eukprot:RDD38954.1 Cytochrome P450 3A24 [Trichoplax sp. H2]